MRDGRGGVTVVVATPPTPNGPLHIGHLSGPYVAADVAARAARARGERVLTMCGLDPNQNYVLAKAQIEQRSADEVLGEYCRLVTDAFAGARIAYDIFTDPGRDPEYRRAAAATLTALADAKAVTVRETEYACCDGCGRTLHHAYVAGECQVCGAGSGGGTCEACGGFTTAATLARARCTRCGGKPRGVRARLPLLRLEDYRDQLVELWSRVDLPPRVWRLLRHYLDTGLPDVPLAYPTDWGIELADPRFSGCRLDVWAEMGLGYAHAIARALDPAADGLDACAAAWRGVDGIWCFHGIDNAFYYSVLFPALFAGAGLPVGALRGMVVNEFYRLDGLKFSTSRNHAIWAHELLAEEDPGLVRLYLCWDRPDRYESDFSLDAFNAFRDRVAPMLSGGHNAGAPIPAVLAGLEVERAERALRLPELDPALAARCLLGALPTDPARARPLLALLMGERADGEPVGVPTTGEAIA